MVEVHAAPTNERPACATTGILPCSAQFHSSRSQKSIEESDTGCSDRAVTRRQSVSYGYCSTVAVQVEKRYNTTVYTVDVVDYGCGAEVEV